MIHFHLLPQRNTEGGILKIIFMGGLYRYRIQDKSWNYFEDILFFYQSFKVFAEQINSFIEIEVKNAKEVYKKYEQELTEEDDAFELFNLEIDLKAREGLVDIYYDSFLISMYSFTEKKMYFLCNYLSKDYPIKLDDISGKGIFKYQKYLQKVCGIDFSPIEKDWSLLLQFNKLRNHLVHAEGIRSIAKTNQSLLQFLKNIHGVILEEEEDSVKFHFSTDNILFEFLNCSQRIIEFIYSEKHEPKNG